MKFLPFCYLLLLLVSTSCNFTLEDEKITHLGGEIINPKEDFILLYKDNVLLDSIFLSENNRFSYEFKNFVPGLYNFKHKEYQYVYIEHQDSIMLRVNTIGFDESLNFSGKGAHKNNFLINTFLTNENHSAKFSSRYNEVPSNFSESISNELKERLITLNKHNERYEFSDEFMNIAKAHIKFHYYTLKERYPLYNKENSKLLNDDFYEYRKNIKYDNINFDSFYPYYEYLYSLIDNLSSTKPGFNEHKNIKNFTYEVNVIDSIFKSEKLKNQLLKNTTLDYLKNIKCENEAKLIFNKFDNYNSNAANKEKITSLIHTIERLSVGKKLPDFNVVDKNNTKLLFKNTLKNKPSVIYFWSTQHPRHIKSVQNKISLYKNNNDYNFIGVCLDSENESLKSYSKMFDFNYDYSLENSLETRKKLFIQNINKIYVIDAESKILSSNLNIFDPKFTSKLKMLNQNLNKDNL
jgi:peroxiredoxin